MVHNDKYLALYILSPTQALLLCSILAILLVASLYIWALAGYEVSNRNDPTVIKQRFISVVVWCLICPIIIAQYVHVVDPHLIHRNGIIKDKVKNPLTQDTGFIDTLLSMVFWESLGVRLDIAHNIKSVLVSIGLNLLWFYGPLVEDWQYVLIHQHKDTPPLHVIRGFIIGPAAEEWIYRCCICSVLLNSGFNQAFSIIISPILFGLSHAHHFYYQYSTVHAAEEKNIRKIFLSVLLQLTYTSIFGGVAAIIFAKTRNCFAPVVMHAMCNYMSLPRFSWVRFKSQKDYLNCAAYVFGLFSFLFLLFSLDPRTFSGV
ncbi:hypothetical protein RFI_02806 [Reticulomyxa filosa]|uniref:intramembrane prenyl-peptidase Rce1 n=1 Tax=Reticulomyxa filosa TaxID=46433 RepID=X6P6X2_RETFI|nr:hypothetical protein RFI_02806 [Reticulomyxa filosa]|eukprot:ETO34295.1 hypothetical protein RFI_02806 [Reticulomyxa filosa]